MLDALLADLGAGGCMAPGRGCAISAEDFRLEGRLMLVQALVSLLQAFHLCVPGGQLLIEHLLTGALCWALLACLLLLCGAVLARCCPCDICCC